MFKKLTRALYVIFRQELRSVVQKATLGILMSWMAGIAHGQVDVLLLQAGQAWAVEVTPVIAVIQIHRRLLLLLLEYQ
jgi:hypothetical protein